MKKTKLILLLFFSLLAIVIGCNEDDSSKVDSIPEFQSLVQEVSSLPGQTFTFTGVVSDPAGIKSVNMKYDAWFLDKTIVQESLPKSYELSYKFMVPANAVVNSIHTIPVTIVNSGGVAMTKNVVVTLDQDIAKPVIRIAKPIDGSTVVIGAGKEAEFSITVTDIKLAEFKIESSVLTETVPITGATYTYTKTLDIDKAGAYPFKISAKDASGNISTITVTVNVVNELLFNAMYITDVENNSLLVSDMFGVPYNTVASTVTGEKGYVFTARYYATKPNSKVRFLPQKGSFEPYTFGSDPSGAGKLALGSNASVDPIVLPQIGYYLIKMDLRNRSYTVTPYTPTDTPIAQMYIIGTGVFVNNTSTCISNVNGSLLCWNFASGKPLVKDANNPYLWTIDVKVDDEPTNSGANGFIFNSNPTGWNPFWRMSPDDFSIAILNGGTNVVFPAESLGKNYTIRFDTHLNAISAVIR